jgi:HSP20 family protein
VESWFVVGIQGSLTATINLWRCEMALSDFLPTKRGKGGLERRGAGWSDRTTLQREMNRMFDDFFSGMDISPFRMMEEPMSRFAPSIDIKETSGKIKITAELPGMDEKDISVSLQDDCLLISGERKEEKKDEGEEYYHRELSYGSFRRMIPLTAQVDADKVEAKFSKGVLKIILPKIAGAESDKIKKIEIRS